MSPIFLLEAIKKLCIEETGDMRFQVKNENPLGKPEEGRLNYFLGKTPKKNSNAKYVPFVLVRFLNGKDEQTPGEDTESKCTIRIITCVYNEDEEKGYIDALNIILKIRSRLLEDRLIDERYEIALPLEYIIYEDDLDNYTIGEMVFSCKMQAIERQLPQGKELWAWKVQ